MKCNKCGREVPADSNFCLNCGNKMEKLCPQCQHPVTADTNFCPKCGANLTGQTPAAAVMKDNVVAGDVNQSVNNYVTNNVDNSVHNTSIDQSVHSTVDHSVHASVVHIHQEAKEKEADFEFETQKKNGKTVCVLRKVSNIKNGTIHIPSQDPHGHPVVEIAAYSDKTTVFSSELRSVIIPDTVTGIGNCAFSGCQKLSNISIPDSVKCVGDEAFQNCQSLINITIPNSITSIGERAFGNCKSLRSITIPSSVKRIGEAAFVDCESLSDVHITDIVAWNCISFPSLSANPLTYAEKLYLNGELVTELVIPSNATSIGDYAFSGCEGLTSIAIPDSVTSVGTQAFYACKGLTSITVTKGNSVFHSENNCLIETATGKLVLGCKNSSIPEGITSIGEGAFAWCEALTRITIPNSVTSIGNDAFIGCKKLTSITISNSVTNIGKEAFAFCDGLTNIAIPDSVISIDDEAFSFCGKLSNVTIGRSVTSIGEKAFAWCEALTSITIPNNVTSIGKGAFSWSGLTSITLPFVGAKKSGTTKTHFGWIFCADSDETNSTYIPHTLKTVVISGGETIENDAFSYCPHVANIIIQEGVTNIKDRAFFRCKDLTSITFPRSLTHLSEHCCLGSTQLTGATYRGTRAEWRALIHGDTSYNGGKYYINGNDVSVTCSDGMYDSSSCTGGGGGCYVATCVYGSYDCPQVWTLRRFRDDTLGATWYGRAFIRTYYAISPTLVKWFGKTTWFKKMWHGTLNKMVSNLNNKGVADTPYQDKNWR